MWGINLLCVFQYILVNAISNFWIIAQNGLFNSCKNVDSSKNVKKIIKPFKYIKTYVFIFCISSFLTKYLCGITYTCEKPPPPWKLS
jgi:hypothetical protein